MWVLSSVPQDRDLKTGTNVPISEDFFDYSLGRVRSRCTTDPGWLKAFDEAAGPWLAMSLEQGSEPAAHDEQSDSPNQQRHRFGGYFHASRNLEALTALRVTRRQQQEGQLEHTSRRIVLFQFRQHINEVYRRR